MNLIDNPKGNYVFLSGIAPYSSGVAAMEGFEIIHATLQRPVPYRKGFEKIKKHIIELGRPKSALCAVELRSPQPFTFDGFSAFNQGYQDILRDWGLLVEGKNPIARTNVAPEVRPPHEPVLYGFSYTVPISLKGSLATFVIAGSGELDGGLTADAIVRGGETSPDAIKEKVKFVMTVMGARLSGLKMTWSGVRAVDLYTVHPMGHLLAEEILGPMGEASIHGVRWHYSRPPISGLEFEMDMRGVCREIIC